MRSVVLFNTWDEPPRDVSAANSAADPQAVITRLARDFSSPKIDALVDVMATPDTQCQPRDAWVAVHGRQRESAPASRGTGSPGSTAVKMKVTLLGEEARRAQKKRTLSLPAPEGLLDALHEDEAVTTFM